MTLIDTKRMRLVILTQYFPPEIGAPQSRLYETALGLQRLGWEVEVITALPNYPSGRIFPAYRGKISVKEQIGGLPVRRYWLFASNSKRVFPRILNMVSFSLTALAAVFYLRKIRPHYLMAESPPLLTGLSGLFLASLCEAKFIMNVSDIWPLSASELGVIKHKSQLYRLLEKFEHFLYRQAYACTGQSQEIVDHAAKHGAVRSWLFRNSVDASRFTVENRRTFQRPLKIVYVGLLGVAQGILSLCEKLHLDSSQVEMHIYGNGAERKSIADYLRQSNKSGFFLHEPVPREQVPALLSNYDLTLIPLVKSIHGAVPSKIYEAMAAGLPILFAGGGEGAEIVQSQHVGWTCPPSDYQQMQALLEHIANLPNDTLLSIRQNCLRAARELFDRKLQILKLHAWLTEK